MVHLVRRDQHSSFAISLSLERVGIKAKWLYGTACGLLIDTRTEGIDGLTAAFRPVTCPECATSDEHADSVEAFGDSKDRQREMIEMFGEDVAPLLPFIGYAVETGHDFEES